MRVAFCKRESKIREGKLTIYLKRNNDNNFTYDPTTMQEIVRLTERLLADHKEILLKEEHFKSLINILDQFASSGWQEALELTWRLKEIF